MLLRCLEYTTEEPRRKQTPLMRRLASKEEAIACAKSMTPQLEKVLACLQPTDAATTDAISIDTERAVRDVKTTFERLCRALEMHREAEAHPEVKSSKYDSSLIGVFPTTRHKPQPRTSKAPIPPSERTTSPLLKQPERKSPPRQRKTDLHRSMIPMSQRRVLMGTTKLAPFARRKFEDGLMKGSERYTMRCPRIDYQQMRFFIEDLRRIEKDFPDENRYWQLGYAIATYAKRTGTAV